MKEITNIQNNLLGSKSSSKNSSLENISLINSENEVNLLWYKLFQNCYSQNGPLTIASLFKCSICIEC